MFYAPFVFLFALTLFIAGDTGMIGKTEIGNQKSEVKKQSLEVQSRKSKVKSLKISDE